MTQPPGQPPQGHSGAPQSQDRPPQPATPPGGGFGPPRIQPAHQDASGTPSQDPAPQDAGQGTPAQGAGQTPPAPPAAPPQPAPGYGYPQQPAGPYAPPRQPGPYQQQPQNPYAQPGPNAQPGPYDQPGPYAQPGPYDQPGPYGRQPGYGYPQPQFPGGPATPPPAAGSRNPFKGRPAAVIGAAVAGLLVVGGAVWAVAGGGDDKKQQKKPVAGHSSASAPVNPGDGRGAGDEDPEDFNEGRKPGEARVLWYKTAPDAPKDGADAPGMWITDKTVVKPAYKQLFAYNVDDGKPTWDPVSFPQQICAVTPVKSADDKVVVAYESHSGDRTACDQLQQIDLNTGKKGWSMKVTRGDDMFDNTVTISLAVSGRTLVVGRQLSGVAYDIDTGRKLFDKEKYGAGCFPAGFAGGTRLIQVASCGAGGSNEHDEVQELDPATGKVKWTRVLPEGWSAQRTFSLDPLVLYSTREDGKRYNISVLDTKGGIRSQVDVKGSFEPQCAWPGLNRNLQGCSGVAADANTLYLPTAVTMGANEIVAVDLDTGKEKWRVKSPTDTSMLPIKTENGKLIAYVEPSYDQGGQVVSIASAGSSHTPVKLLQNPENTAEIENGFFRKNIDWVGGRFYISSARLDGSDDAKEKLMMAFGK
jgi:hypothetical protein